MCGIDFCGMVHCNHVLLDSVCHARFMQRGEEATDACGAIFEQTYENYLCENKTEYNSMATLMLQPQEEVIEALFHDYTPAGEFAFRPVILLSILCYGFFISAYTFGISRSGGSVCTSNLRKFLRGKPG